MDPYKHTREEFTRNMPSIPVPDFAAPEWTALATKLLALQEKLALTTP